MIRRISRVARRSEDREGGFAMAFALLVIVMVAALSASVAGIVAGQVQPTQFNAKTTATLNSAETGLQVALNQIRNAVNTGSTTQGNYQALPCGTSVVAPSNGVVGASASPSSGVAAYDISISYYNTSVNGSTTNAQLMLNNADSPAKVASSGAVAMTCPLSSPPNYAYLSVSGEQGATSYGHTTRQGDRNLHLVYGFSQSFPVTIGGSIGVGSNCLAASGTSVISTTCGTSSAGTVTDTAAHQATQFQAVPNGAGGAVIVFGGNPAANECLSSNGLSAISLISCNSADPSQSFSATTSGGNTVFTDYHGNCVAVNALNTLGVQNCAVANTGGSTDTLGVSANVGLASATASVVTGNGGVGANVGICAIPTSSNGTGCVVGASVQAVADPSTGTFAVSASVSLFGLTICGTIGISGGSPLLGIGFGSSCTGSTTVTPSATAPAASAPAVGYTGISASFSPAATFDLGESNGG
jgi:Tfp pilus assembly protein PilX